MREPRVLVLACALWLVHCVWQRPGVTATFALLPDDPSGPRRVLDAAGGEHVIDHAVLSVRSISLVRCPGTTVSWLEIAQPGHASAHGDETIVGPLELDLASDAPLDERVIALLPGQYCDVRVAVSGLSVSADGGALVIEVEAEREVLLRVPQQALDAPGRHATITLRTSSSDLLARLDPGHREPEADGQRALSAALGAVRVSVTE